MLTLFIILSIRKLFAGKKRVRTSASYRLVLVALLILPFNSISQQLNYSVMKGGKIIGRSGVNRIENNSTVLYKITSEALTGSIFKIRINVLIEEIFENKKMIQSTFSRKVNGFETIKNIVQTIDEKTIIVRGESKGNVINPAPDYTICSMYFEEPVERNFVYSECYLQFVPVQSLGNNRYLIIFPDGNKNYYSYINNICTEIEAHTSWAVVTFKLMRKEIVEQNRTN
jgi:hypothetical protein